MAERRIAEETGALEVIEGKTPTFEGPPPGSTVNIPGLGNVNDFPDMDELLAASPEGPAFVVLVDILSIGVQGEAATKGQIVRLSQIAPKYTEKGKMKEGDEDMVKARVKHLIKNQAIRLADDDEAKAGFVAVTLESESPAVQIERQKRMDLEAKLKKAGIDPKSLDDENDEDEDEE